MKRGAAALIATLIAAALSSCVRGELLRLRIEEPPPTGAMERLVPGSSDLADCLERLGAPTLVWPVGAKGFALAWAWDDTWAWGLSATVGGERGSASFSVDRSWVDVESIVVLLDSEGTVREVRRGRLPDVAPQRRLRSQRPEDEPRSERP